MPVSIIDSNFNGKIDSSGSISTFSGINALRNAVVMWLLSKKGEVIRNIEFQATQGGFLYDYLCKPLNEVNANNIRNSLMLGFNNDFYPKITVTNLIVTPDYTHRKWEIYIEGYCPDLKLEVILSERIKSFGT